MVNLISFGNKTKKLHSAGSNVRAAVRELVKKRRNRLGVHSMMTSQRQVEKPTWVETLALNNEKENLSGQDVVLVIALQELDKKKRSRLTIFVSMGSLRTRMANATASITFISMRSLLYQVKTVLLLETTSSLIILMGGLK